MLINIHVKNFALIDEADLELSSGLNILTGETGAGKSILIDAVNAALGGRLRNDVIGGASDHALVSLVFSVDKEKAAQLSELDIDTEYDSVIISRKILPDKSIFRINDEVATAAKVRAATSLLIDIHGQHEHQSLLKDSVRLALLDKYAGDEELIFEVNAAHEAALSAARALSGFSASEEERLRERDFLSYEIAEIENADIKKDEKENLAAQFSLYNNSSRIASDIGEALAAVSDGRENASDLIGTAVRSLAHASSLDSSLSDVYSQLGDAADIISDAGRQLRNALDNLAFSPEEFSFIEKRLDVINTIEHKYGNGYEVIQKTLEDKREALKKLDRYDEDKKKAEEEYRVAGERLNKAAERLTELRRLAAMPFEKAVKSALDSLNFLDVNFKIDVTNTGSFKENGFDEVEYLISVNPGEPLRPLKEVASGGELSRIMLGFKSVLSDKDEIPTLIFDEIDTGISGLTARFVAEKLRNIAAYRQVICITHLPQIAAAANSHFMIEKGISGSGTVTTVTSLDEPGMIKELARLLGSDAGSGAAIENAEELKAFFSSK